MSQVTYGWKSIDIIDNHKRLVHKNARGYHVLMAFMNLTYPVSVIKNSVCFYNIKGSSLAELPPLANIEHDGTQAYMFPHLPETWGVSFWIFQIMYDPHHHVYFRAPVGFCFLAQSDLSFQGVQLLHTYENHVPTTQGKCVSFVDLQVTWNKGAELPYAPSSAGRGWTIKNEKGVLSDRCINYNPRVDPFYSFIEKTLHGVHCSSIKRQWSRCIPGNIPNTYLPGYSQTWFTHPVNVMSSSFFYTPLWIACKACGFDTLETLENHMQNMEKEHSLSEPMKSICRIMATMFTCCSWSFPYIPDTFPSGRPEEEIVENQNDIGLLGAGDCEDYGRFYIRLILGFRHVTFSTATLEERVLLHLQHFIRAWEPLLVHASINEGQNVHHVVAMLVPSPLLKKWLQPSGVESRTGSSPQYPFLNQCPPLFLEGTTIINNSHYMGRRHILEHSPASERSLPANPSLEENYICFDEVDFVYDMERPPRADDPIVGMFVGKTLDAPGWKQLSTSTCENTQGIKIHQGTDKTPLPEVDASKYLINLWNALSLQQIPSPLLKGVPMNNTLKTLHPVTGKCTWYVYEGAKHKTSLGKHYSGQLQKSLPRRKNEGGATPADATHQDVSFQVAQGITISILVDGTV